MVDNYNKNDIAAINALGGKLNPNFEKLFHIDKLNDNEKILVYRNNKKIVGFIHFSVMYETADLLNIIVDDDYQRQNIGSILMDYMITALPLNVKHILLEVNENNKNAIKLYNKFNFVEIAKRKNYYNNASAIVMEKIIFE